MPFWRTRVNLGAAIFPFAVPLGGRTVIVPQYDQNYVKEIISTADADKDRGIPQSLYMHNVVPTAQGYQSIGYDKYLDGVSGATEFDTIYPIQNENLARFLFSPASGKNYVYDAVVGTWASVSPRTDVAANTLFTTALVQAQSYLYYANIGCFKYNDVDKKLDSVELAGLDVTEVKGITSANGYMIAWTKNAIAWSNQEIPTDFVPSLATGAGGGQLNEAIGEILFCLPISGGFIVYCEKNIVGAKYTGNARFPYTYKALPNSGGTISPEQVGFQSNNAEHYAWNSSGLQKVDTNSAQNLIPEVTDFLAMKLFEDFNESTLVLTETKLSAQLNIKVNIIAARYLVISYGVSASLYTHALVFDLTLKRWGKLKIDHRDCFQWNAPNLYGVVKYNQLNFPYSSLLGVPYSALSTNVNTPEYPKENFAFVQSDGTVYAVNFDFAQTNANGVLMLGKFQFRRNRFTTHQVTDVESVQPNLPFNYYISTTRDGKTLQPFVAGRIIKNNDLLRSYGLRKTGLNFVTLFTGAFNLTSTIIEFTESGDR